MNFIQVEIAKNQTKKWTIMVNIGSIFYDSANVFKNQYKIKINKKSVRFTNWSSRMQELPKTNPTQWY